MIECALTLAGVVLPSLLIALAVRKWFERVSWRMVFLLLALSLLFIARGVFTPEMPVPLDEVVRGYPYRGLFGEVQGWRVRVNGERVPTSRINGVFLSFYAGPGDSKVVVDYQPATWTWSLVVSLIGFLALATASGSTSAYENGGIGPQGSALSSVPTRDQLSEDRT
ncbi:MAG TPA: hypothetical protein VF381_08065 [Thermoanaerobaculia bacterium]